MGIFDKVEKDAEEAMTQDDPRLAQPGQLGGSQLGGDQAGKGMQAAQHLIGKQRGAQDQAQAQAQDQHRDQGQGGDQDGDDQDYSDEEW